MRPLARLAKAPRRIIGGLTGGFSKALAFGLALVVAQTAMAAPTPPGTVIPDTAQLSYKAPDGTLRPVTSNTVQVTTIAQSNIPISTQFLTYSPDAGNPTSVPAGPTQCSTDGGTTFGTLAAPTSGTGVPLDPNAPLPLVPAQTYYQGTPVFVEVNDPTANQDPNARDTVTVTLTIPSLNESVVLKLTETGNDTGLFVGYVPTSAPPAVPGSCVLAVTTDTKVSMTYSGMAAVAQALFDPSGVIFDSSNGQRLNGIQVTLVDAATGQPAAVFGQDGVSAYPSTVTTGSTVSDASHQQYALPAGAYLFPLVAPGDYKLKFTPPAGYHAPSVVSIAQLQTIPGAPYDLDPNGSFGQAFTVTSSAPIFVDVPLDPVSTKLFLQKTASTAQAAVGDIMQFSLVLQNNSTTLPADNSTIIDTLPQGLRYVKGSARLDGLAMPEPAISADGQQLTFQTGDIGLSGQINVSYAVEITVETPLGTVVNSAVGNAAGGGASNTATAAVEIKSDLLQSLNTIIGRVVLGCDDTATASPKGMPQVRVLMEDGSYGVTDKDGRYHFQNVSNGTHVVQVDVSSLPKGYAMLDCVKNTRFAKRSYSQFVELHGGALWRADFHVREIAAPQGAVSLQLKQQAGADNTVSNSVDLTVADLAAANLRITVMLPKGMTYMMGSATLAGAKLDDPEISGGNTLVFRLGERAAGWQGSLQFSSQLMAGKDSDAAPVTKALALFDTPAAKSQHTPVAAATLTAAAAAHRYHKEFIIQGFPSGKTELTAQDQQTIHELGKLVKGARNITLTFVGHTDDVQLAAGSQYSDNLDLSVARAQAVATIIGQELDLKGVEIDVSGRGDTQPLASNDTEAGRAKNRRTEVQADYELATDTRLSGASSSEVERTETKGLAPAHDGSAAVTSDAAPADAALEDPYTLDLSTLQPGEPRILWPSNGFLPAVAAVKVLVQHAPTQHARLTVNGQPVSDKNFLGISRNGANTLGVSQWLGVSLQDGDNSLVVEVLEGEQVVKRIEQTLHYSGLPVKAELLPQKSTLLADGKSKPTIAVKLYDRWGYPARKGVSGKYSVEAPFEAYSSIQQLQDDQLNALEPRKPEYIVQDDGIAYIVLAPTTDAGQVTLEVPLQDNRTQELRTWLTPGDRDWVLVGLADGTAAFNKVKGKIQPVDGKDPNQDILQDGRVAFYAKGMISGSTLLTLAYDTARKGDVDQNGLQQRVDPNAYFMLYGDSTQQGFDASSASKLYIKIERQQFYALFGDYGTGLTVTELARYNRSFNGVKSEYEGEHVKYTAFAARNAQSYAHDEIQGDGTSGLYHLSHQQILLNSEHISVEVRDRFHSEQVVSSQVLTAYVDYTIDYQAGTLFFKQPVAPRDDNFNPTYIVAEYEVSQNVDKSMTAGGRVAVKTADGKLELGATAVSEGSSTGANRLDGVDLKAQLSDSTVLKAELAHTTNGQSGAASLVGPTTQLPGTTTTATPTSGSAYLVDLKTQSTDLASDIYIRQEDQGFGLGQQSLSEAGMRKFGGNARLHVGDHWSLVGDMSRQENLVAVGKDDVAAAGMEYKDNGTSANFGVRHTSADYGAATLPTVGDPAAPNPLPSSYTSDQLYGGGSIALDKKWSVHGNASVSVAGQSGDPSYPSATTAGVDYKLTGSTTLFLDQEHSSGALQSGNMTEFGVRTTPWEQAQFNSSLASQQTEYGERTFSSMGLTQGFKVDDNVSLNMGFNRVASLHQSSEPVLNAATPPTSGTVAEDFNSEFISGTYHKEMWSGTLRLENLSSASEHRKAAFGGLYNDLSGGDAVSFSLQATDSSFATGGTSLDTDLRFGAAHRPDDSRWSFLNQMDLVYANAAGLGGSPFAQQAATGTANGQQSPTDASGNLSGLSTAATDQRSWKLVDNFQANYLYEDRWQTSLYYGAKYAQFALDSGSYAGYTDLMGLELRYDLRQDWDVGFVANRLHSWRSNVINQSFGIETGWDVGTNMWLSLGYNFNGFYDEDFTASHYTAKGVYLRFRFKFDQDTIKDLASHGTALLPKP